jgi:acyl-CoA thioesterase-2
MSAEAAEPLRRLLSLLELEPRGGDLFLGRTGAGSGRLFGGLVAAQSVLAAGRSVGAGAPLHSLHAYFLRPGRHGAPLRFAVERIRDGRTFATRRVVAHQAGEAIFHLAASFARPEQGIAHQDPMPAAPPPDDLPDWEAERARLLGEPRGEDGPVEVRICDPDDPAGRPLPPSKRLWIRPRGELPDDPLVHAALLVFASDRALLSTAARPHGLPWGRRTGASLDHALWLHRPARFDDWLLYAMHSPAAHGARGLVFGAIYARDGRRVASVAQEALIRVPRGL